MDTKDYVFQPQLGKGLLSTPGGWQEIDDWFSFAKKLPTMEEELNRLVRPDSMAKSVYVIHMAPYGENLDKIYQAATGVGSKALYEFLKKHQPKLSLHGHIHEFPEVTGRWHAKIGRTLCIQPGQLKVARSILEYSLVKSNRWIRNSSIELRVKKCLFFQFFLNGNPNFFQGVRFLYVFSSP